MSAVKYKRVLIKLSGEAFKGTTAYGIDAPTVASVAKQIKRVVDMGVEVSIVVGAGNFWRGATAAQAGIDRVTADYAGMLATVINALSLQDSLEKLGVITRTQSAIVVEQVAEPYLRRVAIRHMEKGRVVIFAGGTGNPYMSTDTAAALRAIEVEADVLLMTKYNVDGVYSADPQKDPNAEKFSHLTYLDVLNKRLEIMDPTALSLCLENKLPIIVFELLDDDNVEKVLNGENIGTLINDEKQDNRI